MKDTCIGGRRRAVQDQNPILPPNLPNRHDPTIVRNRQSDEGGERDVSKYEHFAFLPEFFAVS